MKATIDFDPELYRRLKVEAARRGRTVREMVAEGVHLILAAPATPVPVASDRKWLGSLRGYARNAHGAHDLEDMRHSVARKRGKTAR
jgi:hypothetical protein